MTHIKVLYLKPNFSLEKVISAQFLLTSGNFFGNYSLLEMAKNFSFSISLSGWPAAVAIVSISIATLGCFAITLGKNI